MTCTTIRTLIENGTISLDTAVLGQLPMTADGCVAGLGSRLFYVRNGVVSGVGVLPERTDDCWTTREAAERAAKESPHA